jgi:hypothetical protein
MVKDDKPMKTLIAILTAAAVLGTGAQRAYAHDGWATTGKILTGLVIGGAVARAFEPAPPVVYAPQPVVYSAPVATYSYTPATLAAPAPVYVQPAPAPVVVYSYPTYPYYYGPRYYGPRYWGPPLVSFRFGYGGGHHHHGH